MALKFNPAFGFVPNVKKSQVPAPNYKELSQEDWTRKLQYDPQTYMLPADQQNANYYAMNEPYQTAGIKQYGMPTGEEPIYGGSNFPVDLYIRNNGNLTKGGLEVLSDTRITSPFVDAKFCMNSVANYEIPNFLYDFVGGGALLN